MDLKIHNDQPIEQTMEFNKSIKDLTVDKEEDDFVELEIDKNNGIIKLTPKAVGKSTFTFNFEFANKEEKLEINIFKYFAPVIQEIEDQEFYYVEGDNEKNIRIVNLTINNPITNEKPQIVVSNTAIADIIMNSDGNLKISAKELGEADVALSNEMLNQ